MRLSSRSDVPLRWDLGGSEEVNQVAEKRITPKAASATKAGGGQTAARVEKKTLRKKRKAKRKK